MALIYTAAGDAGADRLREATRRCSSARTRCRADPRLLASAAIGRAVAARGRARAARSWRARSRPPAQHGRRRRAAVPRSGSPARDAATSDRLAVAVALYEEAIRLARETGQATALCAGLAGLACVEARPGRDDACREHAAEALALTDALGLAFFRAWALDALAELELGLGDVDAASSGCEEKERLLAERGIADPDASPVPELVEALVRLDRADEAERARRLRRTPPRPRASRGRWRGSRAAAACSATTSVRRGAASCTQLHARPLRGGAHALCHGEALRRARQRAEAREQLRAAVETLRRARRRARGPSARAASSRPAARPRAAATR